MSAPAWLAAGSELRKRVAEFADRRVNKKANMEVEVVLVTCREVVIEHAHHESLI